MNSFSESDAPGKPKVANAKIGDDEVTARLAAGQSVEPILVVEEEDEVTIVAPKLPAEEITQLADEDSGGEQTTLAKVPAPDKSKEMLNYRRDSKRATRRMRERRQTWTNKRKLGREWIETALNSGLPHDIIKDKLMERRPVALILNEAQESGASFFSTLIAGRSKEQFEDIFNWVNQRNNFDLISDEDALEKQAIATDWLPFKKALEQKIVALDSGDKDNDDIFRYCAVDPFDVGVRDWVERCSRRPSEVVMVHPDIFMLVVRRKFEKSHEKSDDVGQCIDFSQDEAEQIRDRTGDFEVPYMVNFFLFQAHIQGASDIHIEPSEHSMVIRNRVDGILHTEITLPHSLHAETVSRLKIMSEMDVAEKRRPQDGRMSKVIRNDPIDIRVSSFPTEFGEKFVLRLLDSNSLVPSLDKLNMLEDDLLRLKEKLLAPLGLIMISGPTGSGKTTTLYSCLGSMDKLTKNILTVEDPVEYRLPGIHQMKVNAKIGVTFATGLRTILRQDPDVIMVGEIRDVETASMAVQAALTGHIVFSTIHTNDAVGVVTRLLDMKVEPFLIASSVTMTIAQRLLRKICRHCKQSVTGHKVMEELLEVDGMTYERLKKMHVDLEATYAKGGGCGRCLNTGYSGRQAVFELFEMTDEARELILSSKKLSGSQLKSIGIENGMTTLMDHGLELVDNHITTFQEVLRVLGEEV